jgi:hypothetical protein
MKKLLICLVAATAFPAGAAFKCTDSKGVAHYEDVPPEACTDVTITEVSRSGTVIRKIEPQKAAPPPLPPAAKAETDRVAVDRQRRDKTLLDTYTTEAEIDRARDRGLELIKARKQSAESQLELVKKRARGIEANKGSSQSDRDAVAKEQAGIQHVIAGYDTEMARIQQQFETDKVRWRELKQASAKR